MRMLFYFLSVLILLSCSSEMTLQEKKTFYYLIQYSENRNTDTLYFKNKKDIYKHDPKDSLYVSLSFAHNQIGHVISMYSNENNAPIDGGHILFELDDLGIIYAKSTTWLSYSRLESTNDSINKIIDATINQIILHDSKFFKQLMLNDRKKKIAFIEPKVK